MPKFGFCRRNRYRFRYRSKGGKSVAAYCDDANAVEAKSENETKCFPAEETPPLLSPFEAHISLADVTFIIEDRPLPFFKSLLIFSSPVFAKMFTSDFKEKESQEVLLPGKKYAEFVVFLKQLHVTHSWLPLRDEDMESVLKLADEYDVHHIKAKCAHHIRDELQFTVSTQQAMRYLWLCDLYSMDSLMDLVLAIAADNPLEELQAGQYYSLLRTATQRDLMMKRCMLLQDEKDEEKEALMKADRVMKKIKTSTHTLPAHVFLLPEKCDGYCMPCPKAPRPCIISHKPSMVTTKKDFCHCSNFKLHSLVTSFCKSCFLKKTVVVIDNLFKLLSPFRHTERIRNRCIVIAFSPEQKQEYNVVQDCEDWGNYI